MLLRACRFGNAERWTWGLPAVAQTASIERLAPVRRINRRQLIAVFSRRYCQRFARSEQRVQPRSERKPLFPINPWIVFGIAEIGLREFGCELHRDWILDLDGGHELAIKRHPGFCVRYRNARLALLLCLAGIFDLQRKAAAASEIEGHLAILGIGQDVAVVWNYLILPAARG